MRKSILTLALAALAAFTLLIPAAGQAQTFPPAGTDIMGAYDQPNFTGTTRANISGGVGTQATFYLVITGATASSVGGFECLMSFEGASTVISTIFPVSGVDVAADPLEIAVGFATPVAVNDGVAMVCTVTMFILAPLDLMYLNPATVPSIPGTMAYLDGEDVENIIEMGPSSGDYGSPVLGINQEIGLPVEESTWSGVKDMFR